MTSTKLPPALRTAPSSQISRTGAWLLVLSPLNFVLQTALAFAVLPAEFTRTVVIPNATRAQMEQFFGSFLALAAISLLSLVGVVGIWLAARRVAGAGRPLARIAEWCVLAACALFLIATVGGLLAGRSFTTATISESASYWIFEDMKTGLLGWVATLLLILALRRSDVLRGKAAVVMTILATAVAGLTAVTLLFAPPVLTASLGAVMLWVPLGILLLRSARRGR